MLGSLYSGISGLNSHQRALDVESHNISNVNTVGFKSDTISFADLMYQRGIGKGAENSEVFKVHNQGSLKQTGNTYDFAINGDGFFAISNPSDVTDIYYTRAGNFKMADDGLLTTLDDYNIMGVQPVVTGDKITGDYSRYVATGIIVNDTNTLKTLNVFATKFEDTAVSTGTSGNNLKTISANINDIEKLISTYDNKLSLYGTNPVTGVAPTYQQNQITFNTTLPGSGEYSLSVKIDGTTYSQTFDTSVANTLNLFSDKISAAIGMTSSVNTTTGVLTIDSLIPGDSVIVTGAELNDATVTITESVAATGSGQLLVDEMYNQLNTLITANGGSLAKNESMVTKPTTNTAPTLGTIQLNMDTLGMSEDVFGDLTVEDGYIFLNQGEAKYVVGQMAPLMFSNKSGLNPQGGNRYKETGDSGTPVYITNKNEVVSGMLELSTSDLSESLVNLMVYQKAFDANSKSITTSDQLLQTAINLKQK